MVHYRFALSLLLGCSSLFALDASARSLQSQLGQGLQDKTLWLKAESVGIGTIVISDPRTWNKRDGAIAHKATDWFVDRIPLDPRPEKVSSVITLTKRSGIGAILPFLPPKLGLSYAHTSRVTITANDQKVVQVKSLGAAARVIQDIKLKTIADEEDRSAFVNAGTAARAAKGAYLGTSYWMVTAIYVAPTATVTSDSSQEFALVAGCAEPLTAALSATTVGTTDQPTHAADVSGASGAPGASTSTNSGSSSGGGSRVNGAITVDSAGKVSGTATIGVGSNASSEPKAKATVSTGGCKWGEANLSSTGTSSQTFTDHVFAVQLRPILWSTKRGGFLYLGSPGAEDKLYKPDVVTR